MTKLKTLFTNIVLIFLGILIPVLLAEGALRLFSSSKSSTYAGDRGFFSAFDAALGWRALPFAKGTHMRDGFAVWVEQNSMGLRASEEISTERTNQDYRVLVLGDSYVWGYGADQDKVFSDAAVHGQTGLEVINFGVSGYGTDQEYLWYKEAGTQFDVDEVVLVFTPYNDVSNNLGDVAYGYAKPQFEILNGALHQKNSEIRDLSARRWILSFAKDSRVGSLLSAAILNIDHAIRKNFDESKGMAEAVDQILQPNMMSEEDEYGLDLTVEILDELNKLVVENGAKFKVTFVPYKPHILHQLDHNHPFVPVLRDKLDAKGIPNFDIYEAFLTEAKSGASLYNQGDNHFSDAGHQLFSKLLVSELR
jgi:lysophospholipase L1-like esterase